MKLFCLLIASSIWIPASVKCKEESFTSCPAWCCLKRHGQNAALRENRLQSFSFLVGARFHPKYSHFPYLQTKKCALTKSRAVRQVLGCSVDHPVHLNLDSFKTLLLAALHPIDLLEGCHTTPWRRSYIPVSELLQVRRDGSSAS